MLMFFFAGTCLFAFYKAFPDPAIATQQPEETVAYFVRVQMPIGITGIVVAGCLAAAMSTLDSALSAIASVSVTDFLRRFARKRRSETFYFNAARIISAVAGLITVAQPAACTTSPAKA
ncbi:MAG: hypothetical protein HC794_05030 [Nitrospiraceae bacterium]|nr:hypothetical protein [Nitrospiraceae bacterium]